MYQAALRLDEVAPSRGPSSGGSAVVIVGAGFSRRSASLAYTHARFNTSRVPAVWESSAELRAIAPSHAAGLVSLAVTQNDQQYTSDQLTFEYADVALRRVLGLSSWDAAKELKQKTLMRLEKVPVVPGSGLERGFTTCS